MHDSADRTQQPRLLFHNTRVFAVELFGGTFVRKLDLEMPIDDYRLSTSGGDITFPPTSLMFHEAA